MVRIDFNKLRFLIIDDNAHMRRILRTLLHGFGARDIYEAEDGAAGLEELGRQVARGHYCARLSRWDGGVAGSGGDVQDTLSGSDVTGPDQPWPELGDQLRGHGRVIARRS